MINLSKAAVGEIRRLQMRRNNKESQLRLGVQAGECATFHYTIDFDDEINPDDRIYNCEGISVVVDTLSVNYINGLTLDYSEDLMGGGFRFHNPNTLQNCGCGSSFCVEA